MDLKNAEKLGNTRHLVVGMSDVIPTLKAIKIHHF